MYKKRSVLMVLVWLFSPGSVWGGTIVGVVRFSGKPVIPKQITVDKDEHCIKNKKNILWEGLLLSPEGGIQNAVVSVEGVKGTFSPPEDPVIIQQKECVFQPHVTAILAGAPVDVSSVDSINHNIRTNPEENDPINYAMPEPMILPLPDLEYPEAIKISCDIHKWMNAYLVVKENPYFTISDNSGSFRIEDVPSGKYEIQVWHEELGVQSQSIEVPQSGNIDLSFEYK